MARGNTFGKMLSLTTFGESHGPGIGVVLDGVPPGLIFNRDDLIAQLRRRAPGQSKATTARKEADEPEILSGVFSGRTLGTPIAVLVRNTNQRSQDYDKLKDEYRPGHADQTYELKYGIRDHRGGGRASGRETVARVIAGYFAQLVLPNTIVKASITKIGPFEISPPIVQLTSKIEDFLYEAKIQGESYGGQVQLEVENVPIGLGEPAFDKLKADLTKAIMSVGAVVAVGIGKGSDFAEARGTEVSKDKSHFGGIEGGISNGDKISLQITFKPTSTVGEKAKQGRHDPCVIPRALVVLESMVLLTLADHYLRQQAYREWLNVD